MIGVLVYRASKFLCNRPLLKSCKSGMYGSAYDYDCKTTANVLNKKDRYAQNFLIHSVGTTGFSLTNGTTILGPCIIFPKYVFGWNVKGDHDINEKSLLFFLLLKPKLEILVIGLSEKSMVEKISKQTLALAVKYKINIETLYVDKACGTFNFLVDENRHVAGAFIPPYQVEFDQDDLLFSKDKNNLVTGSHMRDGEIWF